MVIADDSGLEVSCLKNMPGVYSKRFYSYVNYNNNKNYTDSSYIDKLNIRTLLKLMFRVDQVNRNARFVSVIALIKKDGSHVLFRGECKGTILNEPRGKRGFGYDPIFMPACYNLSFAELTDEQKNKVSHRANALTKLKEYLND